MLNTDEGPAYIKHRCGLVSSQDFPFPPGSEEFSRGNKVFKETIIATVSFPFRPCSFAENLIPELISSGPGMSGTVPVTHSQPVTIPACNYSLLLPSAVRLARDLKQVLQALNQLRFTQMHH